jgi:hypothetical protein
MDPCDFTIARRMLKPGDLILVTGGTVSHTSDLTHFRTLATLALESHCLVLGENVTINGRLYAGRDPFLSSGTFAQSELSGFVFRTFKRPILSLDNAEHFAITHCVFTANSLTDPDPLIGIASGEALISGSTFVGNTVSHSLIRVSQAVVCVTASEFMRNFVSPGSSLLEFQFETSAIVRSVNFLANFAARAAIFELHSRVILKVGESRIERNFADAAFHLGTHDNVSIEALIYEQNFGTVLRSDGAGNTFSLENSVVENNAGSGSPLLSLDNGGIAIGSSRIVGNTGMALSHSAEAAVEMRNVTYNANGFSGSGIRLEKGSRVRVVDSSLSNGSVNAGLFEGSNATIGIERGTFQGITGSIVNCDGCDVKIRSAVIRNCGDAAPGAGLFAGGVKPLLLLVRWGDSKKEIRQPCWQCEYDVDNNEILDLRVVVAFHLILILTLVITSLIFHTKVFGFLKGILVP